MSYTIYEEFRLIERTEGNINRAWKGAHLLLFFLAFVFGSFCTFCFHMLMYLFDEKCVLFPKLLSLTSQRHNVIYEFIPSSSDLSNLPVDFVSTQWVDKSTCELPTYVPLVSGIFGLVWTTVFLMCSTGSRTLTGLQRPWRVLPPVFVFSAMMGGLCVYSSIVTHNGLQELCIKLGEITGSSTCTYTVNVATLTYERRIRGVYQATRLTILTAWLHTTCWLCSALLTIVRVLLVVDFQLVRVSVSLRGDVEKIMEVNETQIRSVMPDYPGSGGGSFDSSGQKRNTDSNDQLTELLRKPSDTLFFSSNNQSAQSLIPEEERKLYRYRAYSMYPKKKRFIVNIVYDLVDNISFPSIENESTIKEISLVDIDLTTAERLYVLEPLDDLKTTTNEDDTLIRMILSDTYEKRPSLDLLPTAAGTKVDAPESKTLQIAPEEVDLIALKETQSPYNSDENESFESNKKRKSNLRQASTQTGIDTSPREQRSHKRVVISADEEEDTLSHDSDNPDDKVEPRKKEKQD